MTDPFEHLTLALADRYRIEAEIGSGGMALVYLAADLRHHRKVAVKVLRPELAATLGAKRFLREIEVAAQLQHPNIVPLLDSGDAGGFLYYVMPYVEGKSLGEQLATEGALPVHAAVRALVQIVDALAEAHRHGIVHRDVKPDNVLLSGRHAVVTDFGVAKAVDKAAGHEQTTVGVALGTPTYMAPEQAAADPNIDHRCDIYAVGVMAYEMLTGLPPFRKSTPQAVLAAHFSEAPESLRARRPDIPRVLDEIVLKCLAKSPDDRWQSAEELCAALELFQLRSGGAVSHATRVAESFSRFVRRPRGAVAAVFVVGAVAAVGSWAWQREAKARWARSSAIPHIAQYADAGDWEAAYALASRVEKIIPDDPALAELWPKFSWLLRIPSDPPGARVFRRAYAASDDKWEELGATPIERAHYPFGYSLVRFELAGHSPLLRGLGYTTEGAQELMRLDPFRLDAIDSLPPGKVRVQGRMPELGPFNVLPEFHDFFLDRYEVTNRQYKAFVNAGGYQRKELWQFPFVRDGRAVSWQEAMTLLRDRTGRPGPSTWEAGDYPDGRGDYPVSGVSWYEAAAYARFVHEELPTVAHWRYAFTLQEGDASWMWPASNLDAEGPAPVGKFKGIAWSGTYDMVGNVREWCFNESGGRRYALGGGWSDESAYYNARNIETTLSPFDRSPTNGFRLAITYDDSAVATKLRLPIPEEPARDVSRESPISDEAFEIYRRMYAYDGSALNAKVEATDTARNWIRERVSFDATYAGERVILYLYLPRNAAPPYQTLIYSPGAPAFFLDSIDKYRTIHLDFVLQSGRALAFPVYKGTFQRRLQHEITGPSGRRQFFIQQVSDMRRSVDYLSTRPDVDSTRFAYYGYSAGGGNAPIFVALEPRFRAAVLYMAGTWPFRRKLPELEPTTFLPRVKVPAIVFSGELDTGFPLDASAKPFFQMLGTPPEQKKHVIAKGGHFVPRALLIRETLTWLDRYTGVVRQRTQ